MPGTSNNFPLSSWLGGQPPAPTATGESVRDELGVDCSTDMTPKGDYAQVAGYENLRRSIWRRLKTRRGGYRLRPEFGCGVPDFVKKPLTASRIDELRHAIIENISLDRRVDHVESVEITPGTNAGPDGVTISIAVKAKGRVLAFQPFSFSSGVS